MCIVLVSTLGGLLLAGVLKNVFDRPRPEVLPHLCLVSSASFPSGHSMLSAVVYLTLGTLLGRFVAERRLKIYVLGIAMGLTVLIGVSRVYVGVHYPTDVLAGWSAGLAWALACGLLGRILQQRVAVETPAARIHWWRARGPHSPERLVPRGPPQEADSEVEQRRSQTAAHTMEAILNKEPPRLAQRPPRK